MNTYLFILHSYAFYIVLGCCNLEEYKVHVCMIISQISRKKTSSIETVMINKKVDLLYGLLIFYVELMIQCTWLN
jgi:hypothetical protein